MITDQNQKFSDLSKMIYDQNKINFDLTRALADSESLRLKYSNKKILELIDKSLKEKPKGHNFIIKENSKPYINRFMNTTGG